MPDYSKDAAGMFFAMRSKMKREPDKVKQTWFFNLIAPQIIESEQQILELLQPCLLYTSPSPRDLSTSRMPSSA